jgi:hypothetical protein
MKTSGSARGVAGWLHWFDRASAIRGNASVAPSPWARQKAIGTRSPMWHSACSRCLSVPSQQGGTRSCARTFAGPASRSARALEILTWAILGDGLTSMFGFAGLQTSKAPTQASHRMGPLDVARQFRSRRGIALGELRPAWQVARTDAATLNMGIWSEIKPLGRPVRDWRFAEYIELPSERPDGKWFIALLFRNEERNQFGICEWIGVGRSERPPLEKLARRVVSDATFRRSLVSDREDLPRLWKRR